MRGALLCALAVSAIAYAPAHAATAAGTDIDNQAQLNFNGPGGVTTLTSNRVTLRVHEVIDVEVQVVTPDVPVTPGSTNQTLTFKVTNVGNGPHAFDLTLQDADGDDFDPHSCVITAGSNTTITATPVLQPAQSIQVSALCSIPAGAGAGTRGHIRMLAYPKGLQGLTEADMTTSGPGGTARLFGRNLRIGGGSSGSAAYVVRSNTPPTGQSQGQLIKSQAVRDAAGGTRALEGSVVTYSLEARFTPGVTVRNARITDAIPSGASYVAGTLTLDGAALTDADDGDAGRFAAGGIDVSLGDSPAAGRIVTFQVRINHTGSSQ